MLFFSLDGSLSDTAVGITGLDRARARQMDQRSPKSETSTQERHGGASSGMGRKSNSTSQLSATGNLSKSLSIPLYYPVIFLSLNTKKEEDS